MNSSSGAHSTATISHVLDISNHLWPSDLAEPWDRCGLVVGRSQAKVKKILVAVDPVAAVVDEAISTQTDLLITHHPLLLRGVHSVDDSTYKGELVTRLIENGCALMTAHTNADQPVGGVSHVLGELFGLVDMAPLVPAKTGEASEGIGRVGRLENAMTLAALAEKVASILPGVAGGIRVAGDPQAIVSTLALCGGAGDSLFDEVRRSQADVYITSDLRHHPASEAREEARGGTPYLIDVAHFASEWMWVPYAADVLGRGLAEAGFEVEVKGSTIVTDPWDFVLTPHTEA